MRFIKGLALATTVAFAPWLVGCQKEPALSPALQAIKDSGTLVVLTRNAPTTHFIDRDDQPIGFEHDLVKDFANTLGVDVEFRLRHTITEIQNELDAGTAHLAAAGLTRLESRTENFSFGPGYYEVQQQVVCHRAGAQPRSLEDLVGLSLQVIGGSSYEERLTQLRDTEYPELTWDADPSLSTELILQKVWEKQIDCTIADSNIVAINRRYFPELSVMFPLNEPEELAWLLPKGADELGQALHAWYEEANAAARITLIAARYYAHVEIFDYVDTARFIRRIDERLPAYQALFEHAGEKYGFDWRLLAAQAYQESHWSPTARSPTGVRGMMMLTLRTAGELGVDNRLDPAQSIDGGARYLANLRSRLSESITEPDRTWIALAAYNVGMGHIHDARALAAHKGKNPDSWLDLREVLPRLSQPDYYRHLRYGYARGSEPVHYLRRIRNYEDILGKQLTLREEGGTP
ncbi:membrane-bound lytic murein transglycosylase MltF [Alcanivorax sp. JB21]|uniref:membrane-bound lytic murein transglycosylase MltF n=1 Tax=Alcanivorax limicola TaxID=2874102 RepID=UPI001CC0A999|nr:membrane-bound lytic murein transglycosylase MltF [Alcanivorax limicola]MBZ2188715.1 membrane-bound lytic murein transglycosylase MltF [Alcanivorax limicola]